MKQDFSQPLVSIIMPTYNRAHFLVDAFQAIEKQSYKNWELIVVDDGSTDNTQDIFKQVQSKVNQPAQLIYQENAGAYAARANGLAHAKGKYIAMYDSDDQWLDHHIADSVNALEKNPDVDWVFSPYKTIDADTKALLYENNFYDEVTGELKPFFSLKKRTIGQLSVVEDEQMLACMFESEQCFPFQVSLIKKKVFDDNLFRSDLRNGEDRLFAARAVKNGTTIGYLDDIHLVYNVHQQNSSAVSKSNPIEKSIRVYDTINSGYEDLFDQLDLNQSEIAALNKRLAHDYFWALGYTLCWQNGRVDQAIQAFKVGLSYQPYDLKMRKTMWACTIKKWLGLTPQA